MLTTMQSTRNLVVNWKALDGAAHGKRRLILRKNPGNRFTCPVKLCLHADFNSSRGLRKHINIRHPWFFYFDNQPEVSRENMQPIVKNPRVKAFTAKIPAFSLEEGIGAEFLGWLTTSCGGGKSPKEALQIGKRTMKFFMHALGNNEDNNELTFEFIDCCLGSASIIIAFIKTLEEEWKLSSSGSLNYVKSLCDMVDFRKANGVTDDMLRCLVITEVYLRRAKENLRKKKNLECTRNLDLETLIARDSWATIEEMEEVIPYHLKTFKTVISKRNNNYVVTKRDLVFCTRFITTLLFLRVKCTRPMTFQYLTVDMIEKAKTNGGFVDQTEFKTASTYLFDTLIFTQDILSIIDMYIDNVRPCLSPKCDYLLISSNGTQFQSLTTAMTMMVHQAIGKHINPTRYRQIVETESSDRLTLEEQQYISEDQKHSSTVAKIYYKKKHSRQVAIEGKKCMEKMAAKSRENSVNLLEAFNNVEMQFGQRVLDTSETILGIRSINLQQPCSSKQSELMEPEMPVEVEKNNENSDPYQPVDLDESADIIVSSVVPRIVSDSSNNMVQNEEIVEKCSRGNANVLNLTSKRAKNVKFTEVEDNYLNLGISKYGRKAWAYILKDESYVFHESRTRDSLRVRADSAAFKKRYGNL